MTDPKKTTKVGSRSFRLEVPNISTLNKMSSFQEKIHGIPWEILVKKSNLQEKEYLSIYLCRVKRFLLYPNAASATFKLLPFSDDANKIERLIEPYDFNFKISSLGFPQFIEWSDLFDKTKNYVKDDAIMLDIKINAENPKQNNKSTMKFASVGECSDETYKSIRMTVKNIENLMAIRSPSFKLREMNFKLTVMKTISNELGFRLISSSQDVKKRIPRDTTLRIRLVSSLVEKSIEVTRTKRIGTHDYWKIYSGISWEEIMKPENGYVKNGSITVEGILSFGKLEDDVLQSIVDQRVSSTPSVINFARRSWQTLFKKTKSIGNVTQQSPLEK